MIRLVFVIAVALLVPNGWAQAPQGLQRPGLPGGRVQRPPRDANDVRSGTSVIRGRVVAADTGQPIRRVHVRAFSGEIRESRMASTDAEGRFELRDLPAGRWNLNASKAGYVSLAFGQRRPFESGRPIELGEGETMARADFALPRGSAVTGRILDEFGDPVAGVQVLAMRYRSIQGNRRLTPMGNGDQTDDTGAYRLYGLPPGEYYVSATLRNRMFDDAGDGTGYAATYYPGTGNVAEAQRVTLALAQEQSNVSFALLPTRTVRITGTVVDSQGRQVTSGFVQLMESNETAVGFMSMSGGGRIRPDGTFTIANVAPGSYTLHARTDLGPDEGEFARVPVTVGNDDLNGVNMATGRGATMTGTIAAAPGSAGKLSLAGATVMAQPVRFEPMMGFRPGRIEEDGSFRVEGLTGRRLVRVNGLPPAWTLKAVLLNGFDVTDSPLEFRGAEETTGIQILVTDQVTEVNGKVTDAKGQPTRDYTVVIFPDDPEKWDFPSRHVRAGRADQQGLFKIRGLPPGETYLAVAVDYLEDGEGGDPEFLREMRDRGTRLQLGEAEVKALDLTLIQR